MNWVESKREKKKEQRGRRGFVIISYFLLPLAVKSPAEKKVFENGLTKKKEKKKKRKKKKRKKKGRPDR